MKKKKRQKRKSIRALGSILLDMEPLLFELTESHELQRGEILSLIKTWIDIHYPGAIEIYEDGSSPEYRYGANI